MDIKRRKFLKIAGISTIAGLAAPSALNTLFKGGEAAASSGGAAHGAPAAGGHGAAASGTPAAIRYGMVIDQRKFLGKAGEELAGQCIAACHTVHNVPNFDNKKDEIKWIWHTPFENAFPTSSQNHLSEGVEGGEFLVLCNHCDNPPCVRVCPTKATFKRPDGIVAMDMHRCIGCRFCMAACPYGARSFNWRDPRPFIDKATLNTKFPTRMRGVVEKCNFCVERLAQGLQPACVEAASKVQGLIFGNLNDPNSMISKVLKKNFTIQRKPELGTLPSVFYII